jgi:hypothetical protein
MTDFRRAQTIFVNVDTALLTSSGNSTPDNGNRLVLFVGTQNLIMAHLRLDDGVNYFKPEAGADWFFGIDDSFAKGHADYVTTSTVDFNIVADWADVNPEDGKICFRVNMDTPAMVAAMTGISSKDMTGELWYTPAGEEDSIMCQMTITVKNIVTSKGV